MAASMRASATVPDVMSAPAWTWPSNEIVEVSVMPWTPVVSASWADSWPSLARVGASWWVTLVLVMSCDLVEPVHVGKRGRYGAEWMDEHTHPIDRDGR